jgi:hypothetical protein
LIPTLQDKLDMATAEIRKMRLTGEVDIGQLCGIETTLVRAIGELDEDARACAWALQSIDLIVEARTRAIEARSSLPT